MEPSGWSGGRASVSGVDDFFNITAILIPK